MNQKLQIFQTQMAEYFEGKTKRKDFYDVVHQDWVSHFQWKPEK